MLRFLDALPVIAGGDSDYPALIRAAIHREDTCNETLPGKPLAILSCIYQD
jgi:hypothetical protein